MKEPTAGPSFTGKAKPTVADRQQKTQKKKAAEGKLHEKRQEMDKAKVGRVFCSMRRPLKSFE